jgi:hypothetical protein
MDNPNLKIADWDTQEFAHMIPPKVLSQLEGLYFCGNFGDPIVNNHLLTMCEYVKYYNPNIVLRIHTNGGARTTLWWEELVTVLPKNHVVIFGIDGLEDTLHLYRKNVKYTKVIENANVATVTYTIDSEAEKMIWNETRFGTEIHTVSDDERNAGSEAGQLEFLAILEENDIQ